MTKQKVMTDKEKGFIEIIKNLQSIHSSMRDDINNLRSKNKLYRDIINKQFMILCKYSNLFQKQVEDESNPDYTELCKLLKDWGFENFSFELAKEVCLMEYSHKGVNDDR